MDEAKQKLAYLQAQIEARIKGFRSSRDFYRRRASFVSIGTAAFSASATVLLGLKIAECNEIFKGITMVITALISIVSAYAALYTPKELWIANNEAINRMYSLRHEISMGITGKESYDLDLVKGYDKMYNDLLKEINEDWRIARRK